MLQEATASPRGELSAFEAAFINEFEHINSICHQAALQCPRAVFGMLGGACCIAARAPGYWHPRDEASPKERQAQQWCQQLVMQDEAISRGLLEHSRADIVVRITTRLEGEHPPPHNCNFSSLSPHSPLSFKKAMS